MRVVACRKARARVPVRIPTSYLRNAGRSVPASRILKSRARSPWSRPNPNQGSLLCAGLLSSSWEGATTGCCRAASGGPASRAQGAAIWSLAAGGARVLGTGPAFGTRGQGPRPAGWSSAWWQRRLVASELVEIMGGNMTRSENTNFSVLVVDLGVPSWFGFASLVLCKVAGR
ncbi:hypothetical protein NN561_007697 [Cricetulus griseus]